MKAIWQNTLIAESDDTISVEGHEYFPPDSIKSKFFIESNSHSTCHWKGEASYYDIKVDKETNKDAAWYYPDPSKAAEGIKDYVAFWKGVSIID